MKVITKADLHVTPVHAPSHQMVFVPKGKTLRDEFAMAAMHGMYASDTPKWGIESIDSLATAAYQMADAMMKAKEGKI